MCLPFCLFCHPIMSELLLSDKIHKKTEARLDFRSCFRYHSVSPRIRFAEEGGFEPPVQLPVRQFSKLLVSATHPPFLSFLPTRRVSRGSPLGVVGFLSESAFFSKAGAKVQQIFEIHKFFAQKMQIVLQICVFFCTFA